MLDKLEFDSHAAIKTLAEMEWPCWACKGTGYTTEPFAGRGQGGLDDTKAKYVCEGCGGTGRIAPFAAMRVECNSYRTRGSSYWHGAWCCEGRGWTPEPDIERAKWRIFLALPQMFRQDVVRHPDDIFQVALAWAQEQQKEAQRG